MLHNRIVPVDIDKRFRWIVVEYAQIAELPQSLLRGLEELLETDVHPEALDQSKAEIADLDAVLARAKRIVEAIARMLDKSCPDQRVGLGFIKWLGASGWGNDKRLILLFDAWFQEAQKRNAMRRMRKLNA